MRSESAIEALSLRTERQGAASTRAGVWPKQPRTPRPACWREHGDDMARSKNKQKRVRHKRIVQAKHRTERRAAAKKAEKSARR
jgi:hypothetical protein